MAVKKTTGEKSQGASAARPKASGTKGAAKKAAPKSAAKKAAPAPVKLTSSQSDLLKKIGGSQSPYLSDKKAEQRTIDALLERKLIKKGAKHKESGKFHYEISSSGKKHPSNLPGGGGGSGSS